MFREQEYHRKNSGMMTQKLQRESNLRMTVPAKKVNKRKLISMTLKIPRDQRFELDDIEDDNKKNPSEEGKKVSFEIENPNQGVQLSESSSSESARIDNSNDLDDQSSQEDSEDFSESEITDMKY